MEKQKEINKLILKLRELRATEANLNRNIRKLDNTKKESLAKVTVLNSRISELCKTIKSTDKTLKETQTELTEKRNAFITRASELGKREEDITAKGHLFKKEVKEFSEKQKVLEEKYQALKSEKKSILENKKEFAKYCEDLEAGKKEIAHNAEALKILGRALKDKESFLANKEISIEKKISLIEQDKIDSADRKLVLLKQEDEIKVQADVVSNNNIKCLDNMKRLDIKIKEFDARDQQLIAKEKSIDRIRQEIDLEKMESETARLRIAKILRDKKIKREYEAVKKELDK